MPAAPLFPPFPQVFCKFRLDGKSNMVAMAETNEDERLVGQFNRGDESAFDSIVERYAADVAALANRLLGWPGDVEEMQKQVDKAAFTLVYQADRLYRELNQTGSAVEAYNRVIRLFPENRWAKVAKQRLAEIENEQLVSSDANAMPKSSTGNTSKTGKPASNGMDEHEYAMMMEADYGRIVDLQPPIVSVIGN
jgi:hypothetical protein